MLRKNASVVCIQACMTIRQGLRNINYEQEKTINSPNIDPCVEELRSF